MVLHINTGAKPVLLDLFCGAGGAARGYSLAGFYVVGVDVEPQPRYAGDEFIQADAQEISWAGFDAIHASPPCQRWSGASGVKSEERNNTHSDLLRPMRALLKQSNVPYVIENVENAPLIDPLILCGTIFPTLRVLRHRLFESNFPIPQPFLDCYDHPSVYSRKNSDLDPYTDYVTVAGGLNCPVEAAKDAMRIDWMEKLELSQAIPPAYTEYIGKFLKLYIS